MIHFDSLNGEHPVLTCYVYNRPIGQQSATIISDLQHACNKSKWSRLPMNHQYYYWKNAVSQRINHNVHKSTTATTVSTKARIKHFFFSIFLTFSFNIYICKKIFLLKTIKFKNNFKKFTFQILNVLKIYFWKFFNFFINFQFPENFNPNYIIKLRLSERFIV